MQPVRAFSRVAIPMSVIAVTAFGPAPVHAQAVQHDKILILAPSPLNPEDSAYVHELAARVRVESQNRWRHKWQVISTEQLNDLLVSSGFDANTIVSPTMAEQMARPLQLNAYIVGELDRVNGTPVGQFRLVDSRRSGLSGFMTVRGQPGDPPRVFADRVVDSLRNQVRAADFAKACNARRDRSDFRRARQEAEKAFELYPNHPATAGCLVYVFEGQQQPADSVVWALERAVAGDSLNLRLWEDLARYYQQVGNTEGAVGAFERQLRANPQDMDIRFAVAAGYITIDNLEKGIEILNAGLEQEPDNLRFVRLKAQACYDAEDWQCALEALTQQFGLDSTLVGDTAFYPRMYALAGSVNDTSAMLHWATAALEYQPNNLQLWLARATLLVQQGDSANALPAYEKIMELDPTDVNATFFVLKNRSDNLVIDSAAGVDQAALDEVSELLNRFTAMTNNPALLLQAGVMYLSMAQPMIQQNIDLDQGLAWLDSAARYDDEQRRLANSVNFWKGFGFLQIASALDAQIMETESCSEIAQYTRTIREGRAAMVAGRGLVPETADQIIEFYDQLGPRADQFRAAYKCGP